MPAEPLITAARDMGGALATAVSPAARFLLQRHLDAGDFCIVLSASPHELVETITVGSAPTGRSARASRSSTVCSPAVSTDPSATAPASSKRSSARSVASTSPTATAYADSGSDLPLLERCGTAVAVNPDKALRRKAAQAGWPIVHFS